MPKKVRGGGKYTVISACYNVEKYIEEFIDSLISQRLDFKSHIFLICVDDGSTDSTPEIIQRYVARYPENITYVCKENGGQASARNLGLAYAETEWVTFCDPDDFLDYNCFYTINKELEKNSELVLICMNLLFYHENNKKIMDNHPLSYKFKKERNIVSVCDMGSNIHLSASTAFFRKSIIDKYKLRMSEDVKPNFEDAHFIAKYLAEVQDAKAAFLRNSIYYYRKRDSKSSTLDKSWIDKRNFFDAFKYGKLDMLHHYRVKGINHGYAQRVFLYDVSWHVRHLVDNPERVSFLSPEEKTRYINIIRECFRHVEPHYIENQNLWWFWRIGMLHCFKGEEPSSLNASIDMYDAVKKEARIRFFCPTEGFERFTVDGREVIPTWAKTIRHDFCGETFILERLFWVPCEHGTLEFSAHGKSVKLFLVGKYAGTHIDVAEIKNAFLFCNKISWSHRYNNCWIIMDRELYADDNAEHLYRYIAKNYPETPIWFVLMKESKDWPRLQKEGFKLLAFGSLEHKVALRRCSKIISSQADTCMTDYFGTGTLRDKQFVFLQHGVTKDDLSRWLNGKIRIDLFVTTTEPEYLSIGSKNSRYKYFKKEVKLTGFPRYDSLLNGNTGTQKILIMPTWRSYIVGSSKNGGVVRHLNDSFMGTEYARAWKSLIQNTRLEGLHERYGYDVIFLPHPNIRPYLEQFEVPSFISIPPKDTCYQQLFQESSVIITDYSSVAFDMAFLKKAVLYYQFDEATFFSGIHSYQKGYFDYRRDGFGPVVTEEDALFRELEVILKNEGNPAPMYLERMEATFPFRDGKNCERVYQAILDLDRPYPVGWMNEEVLTDYIARARDAGFDDIAAERQAMLDALRASDASERATVPQIS